MRRQDMKRRPNNDNRSSKNAFGNRGMLGMQPGLLGSQGSLMGGQTGFLGNQGGMMSQSNLMGSQGGLFGGQGNLMSSQAGLLGSRGGGGLMSSQGDLLRNQLGMLDNPGFMGMVGQDLLNNPNLLCMLANRNVDSLMGSQFNGAGQGLGQMGFSGNQGDGIASLLGDPVGGSDRMRYNDWMGSPQSQAGILGPPPNTRRVMPLLSGDDAVLGTGLGGSLMSRKRGYEGDAIQSKNRFQSGNGNQMSPVSYQDMKQGGNSNRSGPSKGSNTCHICNWSYNSSFMDHCQSLDHKKRTRLVNKGCLLCKTGKFKNYPDYVKHLDSARHKQKKEELNRDLDAKKKSEQAKSDKQKEEAANANESGSESKEKHESSIGEESHELDEFRKMDTEEVTEGDCDLFSKADSLAYDPNVAVGQEHVISVTGYFCKLCRKFYNNETMAKVTHCKAEAHFEKYRDSLRLK